MIEIQEIPVSDIEEFWKTHFKYLVDDGIITDEEDFKYFSGEEYRGIIKDNMQAEIDRHHMIYFTEGGTKIGAAQYNTYTQEDGQCFMLDFWVFPEFRGNGTGHRCFDAFQEYTKADGALYYLLNSTKENSIRFWKSLGFIENGVDEDGMPVFIKR
ncbi:MAG: GNAT family N-acetyltransferase [Lachnospiraceae bacterium]|nr:GNAT family N-acetyltransferase [Lachnospiraceae bacterium]